jgi:Domain of unknown function (DUF5753)
VLQHKLIYRCERMSRRDHYVIEWRLTLQLADDPPILMNSFELLQFGNEGARMPDVVYTEHLRATLYFEGETDTYQYRIVFQRLQEGALSEMESLDFIEQIMRQTQTLHK